MAGLSVGVYFDGFNVYYGRKKQFGPGSAGWKWYSPRTLANNALQDFLEGPHSTPDVKSIWAGSFLNHVVFCTAKISQDRDQEAYYDQLAFINAIDDGNHIDLLELGHYVARVKQSPLAIRDASGKPEIVTSQWPLMIQDQIGNPVPSARFMVSHFHSEEKGQRRQSGHSPSQRHFRRQNRCSNRFLQRFGSVATGGGSARKTSRRCSESIPFPDRIIR